MDYEKAYKEALERVRKINSGEGVAAPPDWTTYEVIFPELCESEDERIRKGLIKGLSALRDIHKHQTFSDDAINIDDAIAWLEKQGEQKPVEQDTEVNDLWVYIKEWREKFGRLPKDEDELVACIDYVMKRQKPTDKVEQKFKVGDWVTDGEKVWKIGYIKDGMYIEHRGTISGGGAIESIDKHYHLWTIQDAKDGDVLATENFIFIFKNIDSDNGVHYYCHYEIIKHEDDNQFGVALPQSLMGIVNNSISHYFPASEEQRDLLFQKMKEAGYEWDIEKKELKEIKQKSSDSYCKENCKGFQETGKCFADGECEAKKKAEQRPTWNKEDDEK